MSDIDGGNKVKIATGESFRRGLGRRTIFTLSFVESGADTGDKAYIVAADGSGLREFPASGGTPVISVWSPDQKSIYVSVHGEEVDTHRLEMERGRFESGEVSG